MMAPSLNDLWHWAFMSLIFLALMGAQHVLTKMKSEWKYGLRFLAGLHVIYTICFYFSFLEMEGSDPISAAFAVSLQILAIYIIIIPFMAIVDICCFWKWRPMKDRCLQSLLGLFGLSLGVGFFALSLHLID